MRILITMHNFPPAPCFGAERVAMRQAREMMRMGHQVGIFYAGRRVPSQAELDREGLTGVHCRRVPHLGSRAQVVLSIVRPQAEIAFRRMVDTFRPDVVIFHHLVRLSLRLPAIAQHAGVPAVMWLHDHYLACPSYALYAWDGPVCSGGDAMRCAQCLYATRFGHDAPWPARAAGAFMMRWRERILRRSLPGVRLFVSPSESVVNELGSRGVPLAKVTVIPNGTDPSPAMRPAGSHGGIAFGYIGGVHPKKGIDVLGRAFEGAISGQLTIRGFADVRSLQAFREKYPRCRARLELFGSDNEAFYDSADVVVVPSVWLENQPSVILEAFAAGRPVLASRIGGIPEMFRDGEGGWLVEAGDGQALRDCAERLVCAPEEVRRVAAGIPAWPRWSEVTGRAMDAISRAVQDDASVRRSA